LKTSKYLGDHQCIPTSSNCIVGHSRVIYFPTVWRNRLGYGFCSRIECLDLTLIPPPQEIPTGAEALEPDRDSGFHDEHRYRQQLYGTPALSPFLYFHGMLFTSGVVLFVTQTALVAARRTDMHRRLGVIGAPDCVSKARLWWRFLLRWLHNGRSRRAFHTST